MAKKALSAKQLLQREKIGITALAVLLMTFMFAIILVLVPILETQLIQRTAEGELEAEVKVSVSEYYNATVDSPNLPTIGRNIDFKNDSSYFLIKYDTSDGTYDFIIGETTSNKVLVNDYLESADKPVHFRNYFVQAFSAEETQYLLREYNSSGTMLYYPPDISSDIIFYAGVDKSETLSSVSDMELVLGIISFVVVVAFIPLMYLVSSKLVKPTVNAMNQEKEFIANASHELKTPLAIIIAEADLLKAKDETSSETADHIIRQCKNMNETVIDMITLSRLESDKTPPEKVALSSYLMDICLSYDAVAFENGIMDYNYDIQKNIVLEKAVKKDLNRLFTLLIDNAMKYADDPKVINITLKMEKGTPVFTIMNTGCQIQDEDREKVFNRFFQGRSGSDNERRGSGIGLAVVKEICDKDQYQISIDSEFSKFMKFTIVLH